MNKQKFKVGDRVMVTRDVLGVRCAGKTGTIIEDFPFTIDRENGRYVRFDTPAESWLGQRDFVWTFNREIKHIHEKTKHPVIVITSDGKTTTATMREGKKVLKAATATCSDKDTFDYDEGARIAFERLQGRDTFAKEGKKPEYYNGKIVCIKSDVPPFWTPGKVYEIKDGWTKDNSGITPPRISSVDEINRELANCAKFIPLVED